jgi:hypothetical protein
VGSMYSLAAGARRLLERSPCDNMPHMGLMGSPSQTTLPERVAETISTSLCGFLSYAIADTHLPLLAKLCGPHYHDERR